VSRPPGRSPLRVPLERLKRLEPLRTWVVDVDPALVVSDEKGASVTGDEVWPVSHLGDVRVGTAESVRIDVELDVVAEGVMVSGAVVSHWEWPMCALFDDGVGLVGRRGAGTIRSPSRGRRVVPAR
jgi:hypothetical protein